MNRIKHIFILSTVMLLWSSALFAQTGSIRGFVYDKDNGEPVIFANVFLVKTNYGANTDINGFFTIAKVPEGSYTLRCTYLGYDTIDVKIDLKQGQLITKKFYLREASIQLMAVDITAKKQQQKTDILISTTKLTPKQIKQIPSIGGEPDLAQYLQVLPGVVFTGDQGGQLYIRGGAPIQNKILLDGMVIYNPFHSIGFFSVFETDAIRNVEVITGGFNAEYGGRISAIVDVTSRDGNKKQFAGKVSTGPFLSKLVLEGPISKLKENKGGSSSYLLSVKKSYLDKTSEIIYTYLDTTLPYNFTDIYGKLSLNANNGSKLNLFGFDFKDKVNFLENSHFNWDALGFGTNFVLVPGQSPTLINGNFSYSNYGMNLAENGKKDRKSSISGFNLGMDFTYFQPNGEIKYGAEILGYKTIFEFYNTLGFKIDQNQNTTEIAGYFKYKKIINKLVIEPSIRGHYYASLGHMSLEPRYGIKYNFSERFRFKLAGGLYSQNLISAASDRDVVHLFVGFLSGPEEKINNIKGQEATTNLQKAVHTIVGTEIDLWKHWELNVETYLKRYTQLININRNKLFKTDPNYMIEKGDAYGFDILLKYDFQRWFVWSVYSLGFITRDDGIQTYSPHYDRRHNLNLLGGYTFGKDLQWEVNARWNLGSGFAFTKILGNYEFISFLGGISTDYTTTNGDLGWIYESELNKGRLPYYHRLDVSIKRIFAISTSAELQVIASVTNVYNRSNIFYYDLTKFEAVNQLPILPSVSLSFSF